MKYPELIESCKKAIAENRCLGCVALENPNFTGKKDCKGSEIQSAQESINQIKQILGVQERIKM